MAPRRPSRCQQEASHSRLQVDYEQLKIQHAQAQQQLDAHSAEAVALKADTGRAMEAGPANGAGGRRRACPA